MTPWKNGPETIGFGMFSLISPDDRYLYAIGGFAQDSKYHQNLFVQRLDTHEALFPEWK